MGNILDLGNNTQSGFLDSLNTPLYEPTPLSTAVNIPEAPAFKYDFSPELTKSVNDPNTSFGSKNDSKGPSTMDKAMGYGGLALQFASLLDGRKTAKLQRKSLQFNLDNARELASARRASVAGINRVGTV